MGGRGGGIGIHIRSRCCSHWMISKVIRPGKLSTFEVQYIYLLAFCLIQLLVLKRLVVRLGPLDEYEVSNLIWNNLTGNVVEDHYSSREGFKLCLVLPNCCCLSKA